MIAFTTANFCALVVIVLKKQFSVNQIFVKLISRKKNPNIKLISRPGSGYDRAISVIRGLLLKFFREIDDFSFFINEIFVKLISRKKNIQT